MGGLVHMGDVPTWVQAAETAGALWIAARGHQAKQAVDYAHLVKQVSGLADDKLEGLVSSNPRLAEIVNRAWLSAAVSADPGKRRLLASVVARALTQHNDDTEVDAAAFLAAAVDHLYQPHVRLLGLIARPTPEGGWFRAELATMASSFGALLDPALETLYREGLVVERAGMTWSGERRYGTSAFGRLLIGHLAAIGVDVPQLDEAEVYPRFNQQGEAMTVEVLNGGLAVARSVRVAGAEPWVDPHDAFDLEPSALHHLPIPPDPTRKRELTITVTWHDARAVEQSRTTPLPPPA